MPHTKHEFGAHKQKHVDSRTADQVFAPVAEACIALACAARPSSLVPTFVQTDVTGICEHVLLYVVVSARDPLH